MQDCDFANDMLLCWSPSLKVTVAAAHKSQRSIGDRAGQRQQQQQQQQQQHDSVPVSSALVLLGSDNARFVDISSTSSSASELLQLPYDLVLDGHVVLPPTGSKSRLTVFQDPIVLPFEKGRRVLTLPANVNEEERSQGQPLQLEIDGRYLQPALASSDVHVFLEGQDCPSVQILSATVLSCRPGHLLQAGARMRVAVRLGRDRPLVTLGELRVHEQAYIFKNPGVIVGISLTAVVVLALVFVVCYCHKGKTAQKGRMESKMNLMMSNMESKVANECKEAFAELQTVITDLSQDIAFGNVDLPFHTYEDYARACLFPNKQVPGGLLANMTLCNDDSDSFGRGLDPAAPQLGNLRYGGGSHHRGLAFPNMAPVYEADDHNVEQGLTVSE